MIERYLEYLSAIRRYSPRTVEIYRGVLQEFYAFASPDGSGPSVFEATGGHGLSGSKASARQNFALRAHPPQPDGWVPPVHEATGGHGFAGVNPAAEQAEVVFWAQNWRKGGLQPRRNEIIREQGFYNQTWCGCEFSRNQTPKTP